jgi:predicted dehydrogenase
MAAAAGANVIVEKPMAVSLADADRMIEACRESNVKLCVLQNYRFFPCLLDAKDRLAKGRIGEVVSIHAIARDFIDIMDSTWRFEKWGILDDFGPHMIDMINFLADSSVENVKVIARDYTGNLACITHVHALMLLGNRATVDLDISWMTGAFEISLKILGTAGTLDIDVRSNYLREIHGYSTPLEELRGSLGKTLTVARAVANRTYFKGPLLYHRDIILRFIESITRKTSPPVTGEEGRAVVAVIDSIKRSAEQIVV